MNDYVVIYDTTLRDGEQAPGFSMNVSQKLEIALALERLGVDVIEAGFPGSSKGDFRSVNEIAKNVLGPSISALARCKDEDIKMASLALSPAILRGKGKIHVFIATSDVHRDKKLKKTKEDVLEMAVYGVSEARRFCPFVEFSCEDFARTDIDYTIDVVRSAIDAGASTINLPDTVGYRLPSEIRDMFSEVISGVNREGVIYSIHAHNDLGMSCANSLYAVLGGARQVEVTINGIGERAGNCALEEVVSTLTERADFFNGLRTGINLELVIPTSKIVSRVTGKFPQLNKAITGGNAFKHSSGIHSHGFLEDEKTYGWIDARRYGGKSELPLTARSGRHQLEAILREKGILYDPLKVSDIMVRFKEMADNLGEIYDDVLVMAVLGDSEIQEYYKLIDFKTGFDGMGYAEVRMMVDQNELFFRGEGNGMINATERAVYGISKMPLEIVDYSSRSLTRGGESKGIESVIARNNGSVVMGIGISEDTVYGAAKALVDATNKMRYVLLNKEGRACG